MSIYIENAYIKELGKYLILGDDQRADNIAYLQANNGLNLVQETTDGELKSFVVNTSRDSKGYFRVTNGENRSVADTKDADIMVFEALSQAEQDLLNLDYCPKVLLALLRRMKMDRAFHETYGGYMWNIPLILANSYARDGEFAPARSVQLFSESQSRTEELTINNLEFLSDEMSLPYEYTLFALMPRQNETGSLEHVENFLKATGRI